MRAIPLITLILAALLTTRTTLAWGGDGHRIVGHIAEARLSPKALKTVNQLLPTQTLAEASTWADEIKGDPEYRWSRPLHYVNMPRGSDAYDMQRDCPTGICVVEAINKYRDILADTSKTDEERAEALKFVVHFTGDLHQPLHASYGDDRGGNMIRVTFFDAKDRNLHWVWDTGLLTRRIRTTGWERYADSIIQRIQPDKARAWSADQSPSTWADESFAIVRTHVYELVPADDVIGQPYVDKTHKIVEDQLAAAGVRLANVINAALDPQQVTPATP